jgi:alanyl-tRNA synthetase
VVDGVIPGSDGRGYVLRRIIRRAIRHGYKLGQKKPFFHRLVADLSHAMGKAYPELPQAAERVAEVLRAEEERFAETLEHGMALLEGGAEVAVEDARRRDRLQALRYLRLPARPDRRHVPRARLHVDQAGFDAAMARQREQARAASKFVMKGALEYSGVATAFHGYDTLVHEGTVVALYKDGAEVNELALGEAGVVVLDHTPFYAESGGQVGDRGLLESAHGAFAVDDTQKIQADVFGHQGTVKLGKLTVGNTVQAKVDLASRTATVRNHSATHLMHKALREVLGQPRAAEGLAG